MRSARTWGRLIVIASASLLMAYLLNRRVSSYARPSTTAMDGEILMDATAPEEGLHFGSATLRYLGSLAILNTWGSPSEIGYQQGRLLAGPAAEIQRSLALNISASVERNGFFGDLLHSLRLRWRWRMLDDGIPGHQLVEMAALVDGATRSGADLDYEQMLRDSAVYDVGVPAPESSGAALWTISRSLTLLAPMTSERGNRLAVARAVSLPGLEDSGSTIGRHPLLHISHPDGALAYVSLAYPGSVGAYSGVNAERLGVFLHNVTSADVRLTREAQPSVLLAKDLLENAHDLDEAISIAQKATILGAAALVLVDGKSRRWAVVEHSPSKVNTVRGKASAALIDTFEGTKFKEDPMLDRSRRTRPMLRRQARARQLLRKPLREVQQLVDILRDPKSGEGSRLPLGHRAAIDDPQSVQCAVFDLSSMILWVSSSGDAAGEFQAIDLAHELNPDSTRAAPPPNISSSEQFRVERVATRSARRLLVLARAASNRGHLRRARELAATALSQAPELPEALLVAGQLAQEDHDELAGRAFLQRFLELGADDLRASEQASAWIGR